LCNLFDERNLRLVTADQDSLHAHILLRRDVDCVVKSGTVEMVDAYKGRIALDRRWPAGLHTAVEAKKGAAATRQGMILDSITLQHLVALYPRICGMTGTAATPDAGIRKDLWPEDRGDSDKSPSDPRGSSRRGIATGREKRIRFSRKSGACSCQS